MVNFCRCVQCAILTSVFYADFFDEASVCVFDVEGVLKVNRPLTSEQPISLRLSSHQKQLENKTWSIRFLVFFPLEHLIPSWILLTIFFPYKTFFLKNNTMKNTLGWIFLSRSNSHYQTVCMLNIIHPAAKSRLFFVVSLRQPVKNF